MAKGQEAEGRVAFQQGGIHGQPTTTNRPTNPWAPPTFLIRLREPRLGIAIHNAVKWIASPKTARDDVVFVIAKPRLGVKRSIMP